ncbi:MAG TPA: ribosome biogenesis GTPase Der, partial [Usitatibacter sp.]
VAVNKVDAVDAEKRKEVKTDLERKLFFLDFAEFVPISARMGTGIKPLLKAVDTAFAAAMAKIGTPKLTRALQAAIEQQQPPMAGRFRPKMRYAHQGGPNPPIVVIHGSGLDGVKEPYKRYLENTFRKTFKLRGTPLRIELRSSVNPFEGKYKPLTEKQDSMRRRRKIVSKRRYG